MGGAVLDVACGAGRHSRFFAARGHLVTALDRDASRMTSVPSGARLMVADLEGGADWPLGAQKFAGVIMTNYLWRPLFATLKAALEPGGVLLVETFGLGNEAYGRPKNPDFLLARGELLTLVSGLTVVAYEDGIVDDAKVIQRICAINGKGPSRLPT